MHRVRQRAPRMRHPFADFLWLASTNMLSPFQPARRSSLLLAGLLVLALFTWMGCSDSSSSESDAPDEAVEEEGGLPYTVGGEISDTTIAVVFASKYGTDTVQTMQFQGYASMARQGVSPRQQRLLTDTLLHQRVLEQLIVQHVVAGYARENGIEPDSAQIEMRMQQSQQAFTDEDGNLDRAAFEDALAQQGFTPTSLRALVTDQYLFQQQQQAFAEAAGPPSPDSVEAVSERNRPIETQHILLQVSDTATKSTVDSVRQVAEAIIDSAQAGISFDSLAVRNSDDKRSAAGGGRRGALPKARLATPYADAAMALEDSTEVTSEPVRTPLGFHVIRLLDEGEPADTSRVRQYLMQQKQRDAVQEGIERVRDEAELTIRVNPAIVKADLGDDA